jgi:hypothetical protein
MEALQQHPIFTLLSSGMDPEVKTPGDYYKWVQTKIVTVTQQGSQHVHGQALLHTVLLAAVSCLYIFIQHNLTG